MIEMSGVRDLGFPVGFVWTRLSDLRFLLAAIPDAGEPTVVDERSAELTLRPRLSFASGEMKLAIERTDVQPETSTAWKLRTSGMGSSSEVTARFKLESRGKGTTVYWNAVVETLGGLLKLVPKSVIEGAAQKVIADILTGIESKMRSETDHQP